MYLKRLELIGFKSFAERTRLDFEPGMTAIVGPNGCGKSNVSDAIRWVLGEQSAKALRGAKMEDCIFNGTDDHKPLGMAEVCLTLADCEQSLGLDFNEVTVTRRVFRSGEGQYLINKKPCRLKDINRLFMDTGVGTNSYSLMEQGRIDRILSARPEDRRSVFEEASGITKYKADKKEAIRKLEHTEANLERLNDIIKEVRRQINSLQRQAGKARRFKALREKLRGMDLFLTRERLEELTRDINVLEKSLQQVRENSDALSRATEQDEARHSAIRRDMAVIEREIDDAREAMVLCTMELEKTNESIQVNTDRIREMTEIVERDTRDAAAAQEQAAMHQLTLEQVEQIVNQAASGRDAACRNLDESAACLEEVERTLRARNQQVQAWRDEALVKERRQTALHDALADLDNKERATVIQRERLLSEKAGLEEQAAAHDERCAALTLRMEELRVSIAEANSTLQAIAEEQRTVSAVRQDKTRQGEDLHRKAAGVRARIDMLERNEKASKGYSSGARLLLGDKDPKAEDAGGDVDRSGVLGALADHLRPEEGYATAMEAVLRAWLDAVLVRDCAAALRCLAAVKARQAGAVRLLAVNWSAVPASKELVDQTGVSLLEHVVFDARVRPLAERLLGRVRVVNALPEQVQGRGTIWVTPDGLLMDGSGVLECWSRDEKADNPVARRQQLDAWRKEHDELHCTIAALEQEVQALVDQAALHEEELLVARAGMDEQRRALALIEGEHQTVKRAFHQVTGRLEQVNAELEKVHGQDPRAQERHDEMQRELALVQQRRAQLADEIACETEALKALEEERSVRIAEVTDRRVRVAEQKREQEHLGAQRESLLTRVAELTTRIEDQEKNIRTCRERIKEFHRAIAAGRDNLEPLQDQIDLHNTRHGEAKARKEKRTEELDLLEARLREQRAQLQGLQDEKSKGDVALTQYRMRGENLVQRMVDDYKITEQELRETPEPEWEDGERLPREVLEKQVADMRVKLESIGPVNMVAIEEHRELEERFSFMTQQQDDLVKAKQQLLDMIRRLNNTTTEMFTETFNKVNENFQVMFRKLFGGGTARLELMNEEDILDCGIEIIARPPGKKLQNISLLSGGERTMTAVGLLFSLYQVKPSPFCLLDELDAALDEANIGRFVEVVQEFLQRSQFVVITHNQKTIAAAHALYGVTMEKRGISKIVSVKFNNRKESEVSEEKALAPVQ